MYLGRVIGTVVATQSVGLAGHKLLLIQPIDHQQRVNGAPEVAVDAIGAAGLGDVVTLVGSREAAVALSSSFVPVDAAIVGIVDTLP